LAFTTIRSASGVDFIGTDEVDVLVSFDESGIVSATGKAAADQLTFFNSTGVQRTTSVNGGKGIDIITVGTSMSEGSVNGNEGADDIFIGGVLANSFLGGGAGADLIEAGDTILASLVTGGAGADVLTLGVTLSLASANGGDGNDTIDLFNGTLGNKFNQSSINANAGNDFIDGRGLNVLLTGTNFIGGGSGDDTIDFTGAINAAVGNVGFELTAGSGNDLIIGSLENDIISAGQDNDTLTGAAGSDILKGGGGNDRFNLFGNDDVTGGGGSDLYFGAGAENYTYFINAISDSAATTSGKTPTFDIYGNAASFVSGAAELNIEAVTNTLAGGPYVGAFFDANVRVLSTNGAVVGAGIAAPIATYAAGTDVFSALKTTLDALVTAPNGVPVVGSTPVQIEAYAFNIDVGGVLSSYLWINDSQKAYTSSDLMFQTFNLVTQTTIDPPPAGPPLQTTFTSQIGPGDIIVA
jgi:hypothetical protein